MFLRGDSVIYVLKNPKWFKYGNLLLRYSRHLVLLDIFNNLRSLIQYIEYNKDDIEDKF
jgi:hypothetical protein